MNETEILFTDRGGDAFASIDWCDHGWAGIRVEDVRSTISLDGTEHSVDVAPRFPIIRRFPDGGSVVADSRARPGATNAWIVNAAGTIVSDFRVGDGVEGLLVSDSYIVATYFDEGVFGDRGPNNDGVAVFDRDGNYLWGYVTAFGSQGADIADCYCATWHDSRTVAFLPYTAFDLVLLDIENKQHEILPTPAEAAGAGGVTTFARTAWFHAPYNSRSILKWDFGKDAAEEVGQYTAPLRGLPRGRFLATGDQGCTVIDLRD